jgi:hypothetical protein
MGKGHIDALILYSSVVPYLILALATVAAARHQRGPAAGLAALAMLCASPRALSFGGKVMVETFLSLCVLLTFGFAAKLISCPGRRTGIALGVSAGLSLLTKLTAFMLLAGAVIPFLWWIFRPAPERRSRRQALRWAVFSAAAVAGPWYVCHAQEAVQFGAFSARYNLVAEGRSEIAPAGDRLARILGEVPGWPLLGSLGLAGLAAAVRAASHGKCLNNERIPPFDSAARFRALVAASTLAAIGVLFIPAYFDTRFGLPIWPSVAVAVAGPLVDLFERITLRFRIAVISGLAASVMAAALAVPAEPISMTCWSAADLIDEMVNVYGSRTLANVGNCPNWNVCKTGLINELREHPESCFVLHDLSSETTEGLRARLPRFDAVVVLRPQALPPAFLAAAPFLNRAYASIDAMIRADSAWRRLDLPQPGQAPPLDVYVRSRETSHHVAPQPDHAGIGSNRKAGREGAGCDLADRQFRERLS